MATRADIRRIALSLPQTQESETDFAFSVPGRGGKHKGFAWVWKERIDPKKARVPNPTVLAVRVANLGQKDVLIAAEPRKFFTEPHYNGYPAILVRIAEVSASEMRMLLEEAWRCMASPDILQTTAPAHRGGVGTQRGAVKARAGASKTKSTKPRRRRR